MNPAKDIEYPDLDGVPDEPIEPDMDEDSDREIPAEHALNRHDREEDPDSEDTPIDDLAYNDDPNETAADHDSDAEDPIEDRVNLPRTVEDSGLDGIDRGGDPEDGGDPLVEKGPLVEDVPDQEKYPTM